MATTMSSTTIIPASVTITTNTSTSTNAKRRMNKVSYINGLNSFGGLKAHNTVVGLGLPVGTEQCFAKVVSSLRPKSGRGGGSLSSTCNAALEIFRIAAVMNGLVLVGVAVGFVLLRIEASVEEAAE